MLSLTLRLSSSCSSAYFQGSYKQVISKVVPRVKTSERRKLFACLSSADGSSSFRSESFLSTPPTSRPFWLELSSSSLVSFSRKYQHPQILDPQRRRMTLSASNDALADDTTSMDNKDIVTKDIFLDCGDGIQIAAQSWTSSSSSAPPTTTTRTTTTQENSHNQHHHHYRILCLHGWLDNCRSFHLLAPSLVQALTTTTTSVEVVALDFVGHGWSSHKSTDGPAIIISESAYYIAQALEQLGWCEHTAASSTSTTTTSQNNNHGSSSSDNKEKKEATQTSKVGESSSSSTTSFTLIGHSFGAAVSCVYAASFPEHIQQLVLLDGMGPINFPSENVAQHVRRHVQRRMLTLQKLSQQNGSNGSGPRIYPSLEAAVRVRCQTARNSPGDQWLSEEAAREMVLRGSRFLDESDDNSEKGGDTFVSNDGSSSGATTTTNNNEEETKTKNGSRKLSFRHDPRLLWPSIQYFTPEQTEAVYHEIREKSPCELCLLVAQNGWPFISPDDTSNNKTADEEDNDSMTNATMENLLRPLSAAEKRFLQLLQPSVCKVLPGSHHFHADPTTAPQVAEEVIQFITEKPGPKNTTTNTAGTTSKY